jgi:hypothetical protein
MRIIKNVVALQPISEGESYCDYNYTHIRVGGSCASIAMINIFLIILSVWFQPVLERTKDQVIDPVIKKSLATSLVVHK